MNPAIEQTFGSRKEELTGEVLHGRMHQHLDGRPYPMAECPLVREFESGRTLRDRENLFFCRGGSLIGVAWSHSPSLRAGKSQVRRWWYAT